MQRGSRTVWRRTHAERRVVGGRGSWTMSRRLRGHRPSATRAAPDPCVPMQSWPEDTASQRILRPRCDTWLVPRDNGTTTAPHHHAPQDSPYSRDAADHDRDSDITPAYGPFSVRSDAPTRPVTSAVGIPPPGIRGPAGRSPDRAGAPDVGGAPANWPDGSGHERERRPAWSGAVAVPDRRGLDRRAPDRPRQPVSTLVLVFGQGEAIRSGALARELRGRVARSRVAGCSSAGDVAHGQIADDPLSVGRSPLRSHLAAPGRHRDRRRRRLAPAGSRLARASSPPRGCARSSCSSTWLDVNGAALVAGMTAPRCPTACR